MDTDVKNVSTQIERIAMCAGAGDSKPVIRGQTLTVAEVLRKLADGATYEAVLKEWPQLQREDILACLEYAARLVVYRRLRESDLPPD